MNFTVFSDPDYWYLLGLTGYASVTGFQIYSNTFIFNYTLDFSDYVPWNKLAGSEIYLFGKKFTIKETNDLPLSITLKSEKGNRIDLISGAGIEINYSPYNSPNDLKSYIVKDNGYLTKLIIEWKTDDDYFLTPSMNFTLPFFDIMRLLWRI